MNWKLASSLILVLWANVLYGATNGFEGLLLPNAAVLIGIWIGYASSDRKAEEAELRQIPVSKGRLVGFGIAGLAISAMFAAVSPLETAAWSYPCQTILGIAFGYAVDRQHAVHRHTHPSV